ncbi:glycosyltransferase family 2 protein [Roseateles sp. P5_E1]
MAELAPIALFTFKRPVHTQRTLEALARNPEFLRSELHIFCDGSRRPDEDAAVEATRDVARKFPHPNKTVHDAPSNRGLAASIISGVGRLCAEHGRVIVVEDDLVVAPVFLDFLNRGLERYENDDRVMQISGHMFPVDLSSNESDAVFLPFTTSWGWATWQRAWKHFDPSMKSFSTVEGSRATRKRFNLGDAYPYYSMLKKQKAGMIDSWAIRWYLSVFVRDGLALYPRRSLVSNEGFDGSGMNCGVVGNGSQDATATEFTQALVKLPSPKDATDVAAFGTVTALLRSQNTFWERARRHLKNRFA